VDGSWVDGAVAQGERARGWWLQMSDNAYVAAGEVQQQRGRRRARMQSKGEGAGAKWYRLGPGGRFDWDGRTIVLRGCCLDFHNPSPKKKLCMHCTFGPIEARVGWENSSDRRTVWSGRMRAV
jgi:hypothetical protein